MIPFGPWLPDRPDFKNPGATKAKNVVPTAGGYAPFQGGNVITNALDDPCQGAVGIKQQNGTTFNYAGDATKLYELQSATWVDVSSAPYTTSPFDQWKFTQFGSLVIAANGTDKLQKIRAGVDAAFTEITASPVGKFIAVVGEFVVTGPVLDGNDIKVVWSARNNADGWTPGINSSGEQILFTGGPMNGVTGGDFGIILQESAIQRMTFVGADLVFTFDVIENARGCIVPGSVVQLGPLTYYWSEEGVEVFTGTGGVNIGEGKVNKTLLERLDFNMLESVTGTIDPTRRLVIWNYPDIDGTTRELIYDVGEKRFSEAELDVQVLLSSRDIKISIDDIPGSIDAVPLGGFPGVTSLDDVFFAGVERKLSAFNPSNQMMNLNGDALAATLATSELLVSDSGGLIVDNKKVHIRRLRGVVDNTHTLSVLERKNLQTAKTENGPKTTEDDGSTAFTSNARYATLQMNMTAAAEWTEAQGIDLEEATKGGG